MSDAKIFKCRLLKFAFNSPVFLSVRPVNEEEAVELVFAGNLQKPKSTKSTSKKYLLQIVKICCFKKIQNRC